MRNIFQLATPPLRVYQIFWLLLSLLFIFTSPPASAQNESIPTPEQKLRDMLGVEDIVPAPKDGNIQVVGASRTSKNLTDLPFSVHVVTRDEILKNQYVTLVDVLKTVPGIRVSQPGSGENGETFLMRGLYGNYFTKILVNSIPIQPSTLNGMPIGAQLPIRQAERIEIIYGPSSAVFGADAVAGVINIITKTTEKPTYAQADISFGQFGYSYLNFSVGGKTGKNKDILHYSVYGSNAQRRDLNLRYRENELFHPLNYFQQNNIIFELPDGRVIEPKDITPELLAQEGIPLEEFIKNVYNPYYQGTLTQPVMGELSHQSRMMGVQLHYRGFRLSYDNMYRRDHSSLGRTSYFYNYANALNFIGETIQKATLSYEKNFKRFSTLTNLSYLRFRLDNNSSYGITYDINYDSKAIPNTGFAYKFMASDDIMAEQLFTLQLHNNLEIVAGGSLQYSGNFPGTNDLTTPFDVNNYRAFSTRQPPSHPFYGDFGNYPLTFTNIAGFFQGYFTWGKSSFIGGFRTDHNSMYGSTVNPRLAFLYKWNESTSLKASFGTAFRAPATSITYASIAVPQNDSIAYQLIPNAQLKPEYLKTYEAGISHAFSDKITLGISGYFNEIDNLIYSAIGPFDPASFPRAARYAVSNNGAYYARSYVNSEGAKAWLFGLQSTLNAKDIIPVIKLNMAFHLSFSHGEEDLPENGRLFTGDTDEFHGSSNLVSGGGPRVIPEIGRHIDNFRMMPQWLGQFTLDFEPVQKLYVRFDQVFSSSWIRRYVPDAMSYEYPYYTINGYYTLDALSSYQFNKYFQAFVKVKNVFDTAFAGIEPTGLDVDLPYNPQPGRNIQFGVSFKLE